MRNVAICHLTKTLSDQLGPAGITVNVIHPGVVETPHIHELYAKEARLQGLTPEQVEANYAKATPIRRVLQVEGDRRRGAFPRLRPGRCHHGRIHRRRWRDHARHLPLNPNPLHIEGAADMNGTILVATAGQGILRSADNGASWHRLGLKEAIEFDGTVRSLAVDPSDPSRVLAGADVGICLSTDGGAHFQRVPSPADGLTVWALAFSPVNPPAGAGRHGRSVAGAHVPLDRRRPPLDPAGRGAARVLLRRARPRILTVAFHPERAEEVWFGVEEGGAWRSNDAGDTWERVDTPGRGINNSDIHAIAVLPATAEAPAKHVVVTVNSVCESTDDAKTFAFSPSKDRFDGLYYTRTVQVLDRAGNQLLLAIGDGTPGRQTRIYRSEDRGRTWAQTVLHTVPNSTVWAFGAHASDPALLFAGTKYGHLLRSTDGGLSWYKEWRDFSEITAVAWTPFVAPVHAHPQSIH